MKRTFLMLSALVCVFIFGFSIDSIAEKSDSVNFTAGPVRFHVSSSERITYPLTGCVAGINFSSSYNPISLSDVPAGTHTVFVKSANGLSGETTFTNSNWVMDVYLSIGSNGPSDPCSE